MAPGPKARSKGLQAVYDRYVGNDPAKVAAFEAAKCDAEVGRSIYLLRTNAGMTQRELAAIIGTTASVICRLEDADYDGHSLSMLRRVAAALGYRVQIRFLESPKETGTMKGGKPASADPKGAKKSQVKT